MRSIFSVLLVALPIFLWAQRSSNPQKTFQSGKDFYHSGQYNMAAETFKQLTTYSNTYTEYATFYYALASYHDGKPDIAKNILLQLTRKYPNWSNDQEAYYWLGKLYLEKGEYALGIDQLKQVNNRAMEEDISSLKLHYLAAAPIEELNLLHEEYPNDAEVAECLARAMGQQPLSPEDMDQLRDLVDNFNLSEEEITNQFVGETSFKDSYQVAVCFPFMVDEVNEDQRLNSNQWVLELYQGIQLAHKELISRNIKIDLLAYDTDRDSSRMAEILSLDEMKGMDLIIGPLYPDPSKLASSFAFEHKINILNPLSSNTEIIFNNPYSFLFHPSDDTQARIAGNYMKEHLDEEKKALIIYGLRSGDSIAANQYRAMLVEEGIEVIMMDPVPTIDSEQVAKFISDNLYTLFTPDPDDPILLFDKEDENELPSKEAFIPRTDIGHVYVASSNELIMANVIGTLDNIGPEVTILGNDSWLKSRYVDFQQLERMKVYMTAQELLDYNSQNFKDFRRKYQREYSSSPSYYSFKGYDLMLFFGKMLDEGGTYFQHRLRQTEFFPGYLFQGYNYQQSNDNAHIPIVHFEDGVLKQVNQ